MPIQVRFDAILPAPFGALGVRMRDGTLKELVFLPPPSPPSQAANGRACIARLAAELEAYYRDPTHRFTLPLRAEGTPFRQRVWAALCAIPAGQVVSYGEIARRVGSAPRAVGQAVGDNPLPILIPCHRVVAAGFPGTGSLGGFMHSRTGFSQDIKRWLLHHEHVL